MGVGEMFGMAIGKFKAVISEGEQKSQFDEMKNACRAALDEYLHDKTAGKIEQAFENLKNVAAKARTPEQAIPALDMAKSILNEAVSQAHCRIMQRKEFSTEMRDLFIAW